METTTIIGYVALIASIFFGITFGEGELNFDLIMNL